MTEAQAHLCGYIEVAKEASVICSLDLLDWRGALVNMLSSITLLLRCKPHLPMHNLFIQQIDAKNASEQTN